MGVFSNHPLTPKRSITDHTFHECTREPHSEPPQSGKLCTICEAGQQYTRVTSSVVANRPGRSGPTTLIEAWTEPQSIRPIQPQPRRPWETTRETKPALRKKRCLERSNQTTVWFCQAGSARRQNTAPDQYITHKWTRRSCRPAASRLCQIYVYHLGGAWPVVIEDLAQV